MATLMRDRDAAEALVRQYEANIGRVSRYIGITETLMGAVLTEHERGGRPLYIVSPVVHTFDPRCDGNIGRDVIAARAAFAARTAHEDR